MADELETGVHIHVSETKGEFEDRIRDKGKNTVEFLNDIVLIDRTTVAAHCVHVNTRDMEILSDKKVSPVNNPTSNLKLASGFAPIQEMLIWG